MICHVCHPQVYDTYIAKLTNKPQVETPGGGAVKPQLKEQRLRQAGLVHSESGSSKSREGQDVNDGTTHIHSCIHNDGTTHIHSCIHNDGTTHIHSCIHNDGTTHILLYT